MIRGIFDTRGAILLQRGDARIVVGNLLLQVGDGKDWRGTDGLTESAAGRVVFECHRLSSTRRSARANFVPPASLPNHRYWPSS